MISVETQLLLTMLAAGAIYFWVVWLITRGPKS
jgi:hypothetical protein